MEEHVDFGQGEEGLCEWEGVVWWVSQMTRKRVGMVGNGEIGIGGVEPVFTFFLTSTEGGDLLSRTQCSVLTSKLGLNLCCIG